MKKILIISPTFLPGYKGGGPVQSVKNIIENLNSEFQFYVFTSDRDKGDKEPYTGIKTEQWIDKGNYHILYTEKKSMMKLKKCIQELEPDIIYLNSFFSWRDSIQIVILKKIFSIYSKIIIAPRGEFDPGALKIKSLKKKIFIFLFKLFKFEKNLFWHATSEIEKENIMKTIPKVKDIKVANNLTSDYNQISFKSRKKNEGIVKFVFVSRITEKKNLLMSLTLLSKIDIGNIEFKIYGPIENHDYWGKCEEIINQMPNNVKVDYLGEVSHTEISAVFSENHFFLFPTFGENYGHVISESLISGCPVIISKETPWIDLDKQAVGWDIELTDEEKFLKTIKECVDMDQDSYDILSKNAFRFAKEKSNLIQNKKETKRLFC